MRCNETVQFEPDQPTTTPFTGCRIGYDENIIRRYPSPTAWLSHGMMHQLFLEVAKQARGRRRPEWQWLRPVLLDLESVLPVGHKRRHGFLHHPMVKRPPVPVVIPSNGFAMGAPVSSSWQFSPGAAPADGQLILPLAHCCHSCHCSWGDPHQQVSFTTGELSVITLVQARSPTSGVTPRLHQGRSPTNPSSRQIK